MSTMEKLIDVLKTFEKEITYSITKDRLQKMFKRNLAPAFLYGGYIQVRGEYKIYIKTVEFYFHSEITKGIHDPIVYHRNGRNMEKVPYFPIMTLNAHNSGFDITFESENKNYRASALIRAYEVMDEKDQFLVWNKEKNQFEEPKNQSEPPNNGVNTQSTYLYYLLNGFSLGNDNSIKWIDEPRSKGTITENIRQNVFKSEDEFVYKKIKGKKCDRKWSFTREDNVFTKQ